LHGRVLRSNVPIVNVSDTHRLKSLEDENAKLKRLLADTMLDNVVLKDLLGKN
jgi:putative transposase